MQNKKDEVKESFIEVLKKLLNDEIKFKMRRNEIRYKTLSELLEKIIEDYENNVINSKEVTEKLIGLAREIKSSENEGKKLGLTEEEVAFYDAIIRASKSDIKNGELKDLVKELVKEIKRDLAVDWANSEIIKSRIRANVKLLLLKRIMTQKKAEELLI